MALLRPDPPGILRLTISLLWYNLSLDFPRVTATERSEVDGMVAIYDLFSAIV